MGKYFIPCTWEQSGYYVIEAESLEAALEITDNPDKWTGTLAHLDALPSPQCELNNNEWAISDSDIREATPEEVATAEAPSYKEALGVALTSLKESEAEITKYIKHAQATNPMARYARAGEKLIAMRDRMLAAIITAKKALGA